MTCVRPFLRNLRAGAVLMTLALAALPTDAQQSDDYRDGYNQGFKDGFEQGYQKARAELGAQVEAESRNAPIAVQSAIYGADSGGGNTCDATRKVRRDANGRRSASVNVTNDLCGDPAPGKRKSLTVTFLCGSVAKTATANEHRSVYISCF